MGKDQDLIQAVKTNDAGTVRKILGKITSSKSKKAAKKININVQDEDGFTALHLAALNGNTEITMALLDIQDCNVNARDKKGMSPLHLASWAGKTEIAKLLVNYRACVNTCADTGDTPLHLACQHHNAGVVEILLDSSVDCTVVNKTGESPLDLACRFGHVQVVELLLKSKDFPKLLTLFEENPKTADPPLHIACKTGREEIVVMLLDGGADVNQRGTNGTALHEAALYGKTDVVKILLDNEADVSITNEEGYTPLDVVNHFTSSRASHEIKDLLREASKSKVVLAKAVHDYRNLYDPTCLSLKVGDTVEILEKNESGRWKGKVTNGNREIIGYFPSSMVKVSNTRKSQGKPLSMKDVGVLPIGKYELVQLPTAPEQATPVQGNRPRMSSFGIQNERTPHTPPTLPKNEHRPSTPNPLTNGIKENRLFQKTQESLQYVEVSVDNGPTSPISPRSTNNSKPTHYTEVLLRDELHDKLRDHADSTPPPSLPVKKFKNGNGVLKSESEEDDDIWIKNSPGQPELPPKARPVTPSQDTTKEVNGNSAEINTVDTNQEMKTKIKERKLKDWEKDLDLDKRKEDPDLSPLSETPGKADLPKPVDNNPEVLKPNYEDMTLNTPEKQDPLFKRHNKEHYSPTKLEVDDGSSSPGVTRRHLLSYENVDIKVRKTDPVQSMLITEVDQDIENSTSHNYENVTKGFDREKSKESEAYETMNPEDNVSKYETMKRGISVEDLTSSSNHKDRRILTKSDSYENVDVKASNTPSSEYLNVNEQDEAPSHSYININVPVLPEGSRPSSVVQPTGLKMSEYNSLYDWLESCKLAIYIDNFVKGGFDMISITGLTPEDLTAIHITKTGHRKKLLSDSAKQKIPDNVFPRERPDDIMTWLRLIHLDQYTPQLIDNGFDDMDFVQDITMEDLDSIGITKPGHQRKLWLAVGTLNATTTNTNPVITHGEMYLETDLDMVHENTLQSEKEREVRSTDIDSVLSRLPADGASDSCFHNEEVTTVVRKQKEQSDQVVENAVASLHIESLDETRGSTPDLDTILDSLDDEPSQQKRSPSQPKIKKPSEPPQNSSAYQPGLKKPSEPPQNSSPNQPGLKKPSEPPQNSPANQPGLKNSSGPLQITARPKIPLQLETRESPTTRTDASNGQRTSAEMTENNIKSRDNVTESSESPKSSPLRARHNSIENKTASQTSSIEDRSRGLSFDSKSPSKKPPPPVKPKSFKKPPPKIAPKPKLTQSQSLESEINKLESQVEHENTERRYTTGQNIRSKQPPTVLPKARHGSVHSTSSEGSIDSVLGEVEHHKHFEDRRRSFEQLRRRFTDPDSTVDSGIEDKSEPRTDSEVSGLENQIKEVFRRSRENLVDVDQSELPEESPQLDITDVTDDDLERDQQITEDLMKDINSMLSDFSTEIDCMFDAPEDNSTSV